MTTSSMMNKTAALSNSFFVEQDFAKPTPPSKATTSSPYWANVLNAETMSMDESKNLVSNKPEQTKRRICWWM